MASISAINHKYILLFLVEQASVDFCILYEHFSDICGVSTFENL